MRSIGGIYMKLRVYCEMCDKEYILEVGQPWVGIMTCPHDVEHHILKEVIDDGEIYKTTLSGRD